MNNIKILHVHVRTYECLSITCMCNYIQVSAWVCYYNYTCMCTRLTFKVFFFPFSVFCILPGCCWQCQYRRCVNLAQTRSVQLYPSPQQCATTGTLFHNSQVMHVVLYYVTFWTQNFWCEGFKIDVHVHVHVHILVPVHFQVPEKL